METDKIEKLNRNYINFSFMVLIGVNVLSGQIKIPVAV